MIRAERSVTVERAIDEVFAYLADGRNNVRWRDGVLEIEPATEATGEGVTYRQVLKGPAGRPIRGDYRITRHDRPHTLEFAVIAGPARPTGRFRLEPAGDGRTRVTFVLELEPRGPSRLLAPLIRRQMQREVAALDQLRGQLEST